MIIVKRFTATWCKPCTTLAPIMAEVIKETEGVEFQVIDIDNNEEEARKYNIRSIPTVLIIKENIVLDRLIGIQPKNVYISTITHYKQK